MVRFLDLQQNEHIFLYRKRLHGPADFTKQDEKGTL